MIELVLPQDCAKEIANLDLYRDALPHKQSALGLCGNVKSDTLCFKVNIKLKSLTRRGILSVANSFYDPLGIGAPAIQPMKVLLQKLCVGKLDWDEKIPEREQEQWKY